MCRHAAEAYKRGLRCLKKPPPPLNNPDAEKEKEIANGLYKQGTPNSNRSFSPFRLAPCSCAYSVVWLPFAWDIG